MPRYLAKFPSTLPSLIMMVMLTIHFFGPQGMYRVYMCFKCGQYITLIMTLILMVMVTLDDDDVLPSQEVSLTLGEGSMREG